MSSCNANNATIDERNKEVAELVSNHQFAYPNLGSFGPVSVRSTAAQGTGAEEPNKDSKEREQQPPVEVVVSRDIRLELERANDGALEVEMSDESKDNKEVQNVINLAREKAKTSLDRIEMSVRAPKVDEGALEVANNYCVACRHVQVLAIGCENVAVQMQALQGLR